MGKYVCDICDRSFSSELGLKIHSGRKHKVLIEIRICALEDCQITFTCKETSPQKFCSRRCGGIAFGRRKKGRTSWNKGLTKETDERVSAHSKKMKGKIPWSKGLTKEVDPRIEKSTEKMKKTKQKFREENPDLWEEKEKRRGEKISKTQSDPTFRKGSSERAKKLWKTPGYRLNQARSRTKGKKNKAEKKLEKILNFSFPKEWKYVGDFSFVLEGKSPDFTNINGQKKIIELFGNYYHSEEVTGIPEDQHEQERIDLFAKYGYQTLIIWERELENMEVLQTRLMEFC